MKCFNHRTIDAVGACRVCGKGLCHECFVDLGHSLTCKGSCAEKAERYESDAEEMRKRWSKSAVHEEQLAKLEAMVPKLASTRTGLFLSSLLVLTGVPIFIAGFSAGDRFGLGRYLGGLFVVMGIVYFFVQRKAAKIVRGDNA